MLLVERVMDRVAEHFAGRLWERMEADGTLPLPERLYDVVVDDPDMAEPHTYRGLPAVSAAAAGSEAYRQAMRDEGCRCVVGHPQGDEQTVEAAARAVPGGLYAVVRRAGEHPQLDYETPRA